MPSQVIGEWTDKHQKAIEAWASRVIERKLREFDEEQRANRAKGVGKVGQAVSDH